MRNGDKCIWRSLRAKLSAHGPWSTSACFEFSIPRIVVCAQCPAAVLHLPSRYVLAKGTAYNTVYFQYRSKVTALNSHIGRSRPVSLSVSSRKKFGKPDSEWQGEISDVYCKATFLLLSR